MALGGEQKVENACVGKGTRTKMAFGAASTLPSSATKRNPVRSGRREDSSIQAPILRPHPKSLKALSTQCDSRKALSTELSMPDGLWSVDKTLHDLSGFCIGPEYFCGFWHGGTFLGPGSPQKPSVRSGNPGRRSVFFVPDSGRCINIISTVSMKQLAPAQRVTMQCGAFSDIVLILIKRQNTLTDTRTTLSFNVIRSLISVDKCL